MCRATSHVAPHDEFGGCGAVGALHAACLKDRGRPCLEIDRRQGKRHQRAVQGGGYGLAVTVSRGAAIIVLPDTTWITRRSGSRIHEGRGPRPYHAAHGATACGIDHPAIGCSLALQSMKRDAALTHLCFEMVGIAAAYPRSSYAPRPSLSNDQDAPSPRPRAPAGRLRSAMPPGGTRRCGCRRRAPTSRPRARARSSSTPPTYVRRRLVSLGMTISCTRTNVRPFGSLAVRTYFIPIAFPRSPAPEACCRRR